MKTRSRGMTLIEVLVALAIFATAAIATIRSVSQHINTLNYLEEKTFAAMVADNQLAKVVLQPQALRKQTGKEKLAGREWFWTVTPVPTSDGLLQAFDVSVAAQKSGSSIVTVRSYLAK